MKKLFIISLFTFLLFQSFNYGLAQVSEQTAIKEEIPEGQREVPFYGQRDSLLYENEYGSIYVSNQMPSNYLKWFNLDDSKDSLYIHEYTDYIAEQIQENQQTYIKVNSPLKEKLWSRVYRFNNQLCMYSPSDWFIVSTMKITDSTIFDMRSANPMFYLIQKYTQPNKNTFQYTAKEVYTNQTVQFTVEIINEKMGLVLWKAYREIDNYFQSYLTIDASKVGGLPILIEDCGDQKCFFNQDFNFFDPMTEDFIRLLRNQ